jgi:hypothetical protein
VIYYCGFGAKQVVYPSKPRKLHELEHKIRDTLLMFLLTS